jgi:hypothetical protein
METKQIKARKLWLKKTVIVRLTENSASAVAPTTATPTCGVSGTIPTCSGNTWFD